MLRTNPEEGGNRMHGLGEIASRRGRVIRATGRFRPAAVGAAPYRAVGAATFASRTVAIAIPERNGSTHERYIQTTRMMHSPTGR